MKHEDFFKVCVSAIEDDGKWTIDLNLDNDDDIVAVHTEKENIVDALNDVASQLRIKRENLEKELDKDAAKLEAELVAAKEKYAEQTRVAMETEKEVKEIENRLRSMKSDHWRKHSSKVCDDSYFKLFASLF